MSPPILLWLCLEPRGQVTSGPNLVATCASCYKGFFSLLPGIQLCISSIISCAPLLSGKSTLTKKFTPAVLQASFCDVRLYITCVTSAAVVHRASRCGASFKPNFMKSLSVHSKVVAIPIFNTQLLSLLLQWWHWLLRNSSNILVLFFFLLYITCLLGLSNTFIGYINK